MKNFTGKFTAISTAGFLLLTLFVLVNPASAQTKKKTTKKKVTIAKTGELVIRDNPEAFLVTSLDKYCLKSEEIR